MKMSGTQLPEIIRTHEQAILREWMQRQTESITTRRDLMSEADLHRQSRDFLSAFQKIARQGALGFDERVDAILDRATADELVHEDRLSLANPERPVGRLVLDRRIPPAVEVADVVRRHQVQPGSAGFQRKDEHGRSTGAFAWRDVRKLIS